MQELHQATRLVSTTAGVIERERERERGCGEDRRERRNYIRLLGWFQLQQVS